MGVRRLVEYFVLCYLCFRRLGYPMWNWLVQALLCFCVFGHFSLASEFKDITTVLDRVEFDQVRVVADELCWKHRPVILGSVFSRYLVTGFNEYGQQTAAFGLVWLSTGRNGSTTLVDLVGSRDRFIANAAVHELRLKWGGGRLGFLVPKYAFRNLSPEKKRQVVFSLLNAVDDFDAPSSVATTARLIRNLGEPGEIMDLSRAYLDSESITDSQLAAATIVVTLKMRELGPGASFTLLEDPNPHVREVALEAIRNRLGVGLLGVAGGSAPRDWEPSRKAYLIEMLLDEAWRGRLRYSPAVTASLLFRVTTQEHLERILRHYLTGDHAPVSIEAATIALNVIHRKLPLLPRCLSVFFAETVAD
jgi:hypothetical protein